MVLKAQHAECRGDRPGQVCSTVSCRERTAACKSMYPLAEPNSPIAATFETRTDGDTAVQVIAQHSKTLPTLSHELTEPITLDKRK